MPNFFHSLASPKYFYQLAGKCLPIIWILCLLLYAYGFVGGLYFAPPDYQQGDAYRIIYIHVPCATLSLSIFMIMAVSSTLYITWGIKLADQVAQVSAPIGAWFTFLALVTGSLWGKPMWGTWWIWDARLTSELILLFLYIGVMALRTSLPNRQSAGKAAGILTLVGVVDIPIIHYSVNWWNTLHQKATLLQFAKPTLSDSMLYPLLSMLFASFLYYLAMMLMGVRKSILNREAATGWVKKEKTIHV